MALDGLTFLEAERAMPLLTLPLRTTIVALGDARVMYAPASTLPVEAFASAGAITDIVVPNLLHTEGALPAASAHPEARLWGPEGAADKQPSLRWHGVLGRDPWPYDSELRHVAIGGMPGIRESVLLHGASGSLLVGDLAFNIVDASGVGAWVLLHLFGTWRRFGVSRVFARFIKDRAAFEASVTELAGLEFRTVVPAHGAILTSEGRDRLLAALAERGYRL